MRSWHGFVHCRGKARNNYRNIIVYYVYMGARWAEPSRRRPRLVENGALSARQLQQGWLGTSESSSRPGRAVPQNAVIAVKTSLRIKSVSLSCEGMGTSCPMMALPWPPGSRTMRSFIMAAGDFCSILNLKNPLARTPARPQVHLNARSRAQVLARSHVTVFSTMRVPSRSHPREPRPGRRRRMIIIISAPTPLVGHGAGYVFARARARVRDR